jgi:hypothetical protein
VVVAIQGLLPQEGHQVAKFERGNASSKLQCSILLSAALQLIIDAFTVPRLEHLIK